MHGRERGPRAECLDQAAPVTHVHPEAGGHVEPEDMSLTSQGQRPLLGEMGLMMVVIMMRRLTRVSSDSAPGIAGQTFRYGNSQQPYEVAAT